MTNDRVVFFSSNAGSHHQRCFVSAMLLAVFLSAGLMPGTSLAQEGKTNGDRQKRSSKKGNQASKKGERGTGGPTHIFTEKAPKHAFDYLLVRPTDSSIGISVYAYEPIECYATFGLSADEQQSQTKPISLKADDASVINLTGLQPNTCYHYTLHVKQGKSTTDSAEPGAKQSGWSSEPSASFQTARARDATWTFTVQSDSHLDQATRLAMYQKTLDNVIADKPDFHVDVGDTFMTDKYEEYQASLPQYFAQRYILSRVAHRSPILLVPGNHDGERLDRYDGTLDCMPAWSNLTRKKLFPNPFPNTFYTGNKTPAKGLGLLENYFAFEWGQALIVGLDPFWYTGKRSRNRTDGNWVRTLGEEQFRWLEQTLARSKASYKFVFIHHLVGGLDDSARGGSEAAELFEWGGKNKEGVDEFAERRKGWSMPIHQLLVKHGVDVVFHGHDHFYAKQDLDSVVYLMVPQPGNANSGRLRNVDEYGYLRGTFLPPSGHIRVTITPIQANVEYIRASLSDGSIKNATVGHSFSIAP